MSALDPFWYKGYFLEPGGDYRHARWQFWNFKKIIEDETLKQKGPGAEAAVQTVDLSGSDFTHAILTGTNWYHVELKSVDFTASDNGLCDFRQAIFNVPPISHRRMRMIRPVGGPPVGTTDAKNLIAPKQRVNGFDKTLGKVGKSNYWDPISGHAVFMFSMDNYIGTDFSKCSLVKDRFNLCALSNSTFNRAFLKRCTFFGCDLENVDFTGAHVERITFTGCWMSGCRFDYAFLGNTRFESCYMGGPWLDQNGILREEFLQDTATFEHVTVDLPASEGSRYDHNDTSIIDTEAVFQFPSVNNT